MINYDVPHDPEDYIHRIGRTARAAATGSAITFVNEEEQGKFHQIEKFIEREIRKAELPASVGEGPKYEPEEGRKRGGRGGRGRSRSKGGDGRGHGRGRRDRLRDKPRGGSSSREREPGGDAPRGSAGTSGASVPQSAGAASSGNSGVSAPTAPPHRPFRAQQPRRG